MTWNAEHMCFGMEAGPKLLHRLNACTCGCGKTCNNCPWLIKPKQVKTKKPAAAAKKKKEAAK